MSARVDEEAAWALVRALTPGAPGAEAPALVRAEAVPGVSLTVHADGSWRADGAVSEEARTLLDIFLPIRVASDFVVAQLGQSLDGRIATESGASHYVTGPHDIRRLHRLRALADAVVVGASTVAQDDPRLTVRLVDGEDPVRVVLDPSGRLTGDRRVFDGPHGGPTLVVRGGEGGDGPGTEGLPIASYEELRVPWARPGELDLLAVVETLRARGLRRILVEGGGVTVSRFLAAGLLDRLHVAVAPLLIGSGRPSLTLEPVDSLEEALRPACRRFMLGEDVLFDLDLRAPRTRGR